MSTATDTHHDEHHGPATGMRRWLFTTNHKDIGSMYLWFSLIMFFVGGAMAMVIRAELIQPGMNLVDPMFYNQMVSDVLQPDGYHARTDYDFRCGHAGLRGSGQLDDSHDGGGAGYGPAEAQ